VTLEIEDLLDSLGVEKSKRPEAGVGSGKARELKLKTK
jgi:hypothetical protein